MLLEAVLDATIGNKCLVIMPDHAAADKAKGIVREWVHVDREAGTCLYYLGGGSLTFRTVLDSRGSDGFLSAHIYLDHTVERAAHA
jgi:hypothetical protein